ncbi:MAG: glycoside hydrolase family 25 protein [Ruminococcus sp.]|jgi:GH25 family lysozyme M1 (1,4-beta-N-acetylmuramidase)|nr:glycoside hydrolase family 25 protein [Ruminococcus sp.]
MMEKMLIDVSHHNGVIDWAKVKASGIDGAIIRAGYGKVLSQKDKCFDANIKGCEAVGMPYGIYWYSYAKTPADARKEAAVCLKIIKNCKPLYPIYFDIEDGCQIPLTKELCTEITKAFCGCIEAAGYFAGVYSFDSFFATNLEKTIPETYSAWVARVGGQKPAHCKNYAVHQYSWEEKVPGITGDVDMNFCYKDFPGVIRKAHLNGY